MDTELDGGKGNQIVEKDGSQRKKGKVVHRVPVIVTKVRVFVTTDHEVCSWKFGEGG